MKKVIIISIILAALLACGGALAIFIAAQDGGIPAESIPAENTPAENVLPADENISADDEVKPVKTTLTIEEVLAAVELAKKQYAENDPICEKLGITPDPLAVQIFMNREADLESLVDTEIRLLRMYSRYTSNIFTLVYNNLGLDNLHENMKCSLVERLGGLSPYNTDAYDDAYIVLCDLNNGLFDSAKEFAVKTRSRFPSVNPLDIGCFVFYPRIAEIEYYAPGSLCDAPIKTSDTVVLWPDSETSACYSRVQIFLYGEQFLY